MNQDFYHTPALLAETLEQMDIKPDGVYVDCTMGGGGHSRAILRLLGPEGKLYAIDCDKDALNRISADEELGGDTRFVPIYGNFRYLRNYMDFYGLLGRVDGILADLGVSSHHFDASERGFSFRADGPLDMRMNVAGGETAAELIAAASEDEIATLLQTYGELKNARRMARVIVAAREQAPIDTTARLVDVVSPLINPAREKKELAQVFQALRIAVNGEDRSLDCLLKASVDVLAAGGTLAVISYHSLEDKKVKNFMRSGNIDGRVETDIFGRSSVPFKPYGSKATVPGDAEVEANPRSRSAKLRTAVLSNPQALGK